MELKDRVVIINEKNMEWLKWLHENMTVDKLEMIVNGCIRNMIVEVLEDDWDRLENKSAAPITNKNIALEDLDSGR